MLLASFRTGGKLLVCGNGGSAADAEHIVGELMKCFRKRREIPESIAAKLRPELVAKLEGALPAISLVSMEGLLTAFANDVAWETAFAQQVLALARPGDVLVALDTFTPSDPSDRLTPADDGVTLEVALMLELVLTETPLMS